MEQGYYTFWFIIVFIIFYLATIQTDNQKRILYFTISGIFFLAMAFLSFGVENVVYDVSIGNFTKYNEANYTLQGMFPFALNLILFFLCLLELVICVGEEWNKNLKGLKTPKGF